MKNLIKNISLIIIIPFLLSGCSQNFLSTQPLDQVSSEVVWADGPLAEAFVTDIYNGLGNGGLDEQMLSSLSDESVFTHPGRGIKEVNEGTINSDNLGWVPGTYEWGSLYKSIRACNLAIENLQENATFEDQNLNERLQGEAYFMRAYFYHQLVRYYGGVPIIDSSYGLDGDFKKERSSFGECVDFIVSDCERAVSLLSNKQMEKGRASEAAALALKSRILLYAASDLHDIPTASSNSALIGGYQSSELLGYTQGNRQERWEKAKDAARAVLDLEDYGYKTDLDSPVLPEEGTNNYISLSLGGESSAAMVDPAASNDLIFARYFSADKDEGGNYVGRNNGPNGYHNWSGNTPIGLLVDDYEMIDGSPFSWDDPNIAKHPYQDRDPRFYATILYDGADWKPREIVSGNVDPANQIQTGSYEGNGGSTIFGLDTRESSIEDWNGSWTGYYFRKFTDPNPDIVEQTGRQFIPWPFFRYTEAMLNYAEACINLGEDGEAVDWINKIRFRAGMPALSAANSSGTALRDAYRLERRIELAYEEQRYHDARRWMIAPSTLGRTVEFISVEGKLKSGKTAPSPYHYDEDVYDYKYTVTEDKALENRRWDDKLYFGPLSRDEVRRNDLLVQNPGYSD